MRIPCVILLPLETAHMTCSAKTMTVLTDDPDKLLTGMTCSAKTMTAHMTCFAKFLTQFCLAAFGISRIGEAERDMLTLQHHFF